MIEATGISALAVHGRDKNERSQDPVHSDVIKKISQKLSIPVIANGASNDINSFEDIMKFRELTSSSSVMIARKAQWNPSIFRKDGPVPVNEVVKEYIKLAVDYDNHDGNTKYCLAQMMHENMDSVEGRRLLSAHSMQEICDIWGLLSYYEEAIKTRGEKIEKLCLRERQELGLQSQFASLSKKIELDPEVTEDGTLELYVHFNKFEFTDSQTPKSVLYEWTRKRNIHPPSYNTIQRKKDKMFKSILTVEDQRYSSSLWEKNKRFAEQSAAMVALSVRNINTHTRSRLMDD